MSESADITARDARTAAEVLGRRRRAPSRRCLRQALLGATEKEGLTAGRAGRFGRPGGGSPHADTRAWRTSSLRPWYRPTTRPPCSTACWPAGCPPLFLVFLKVVARHGRLDCLRAIHRRARVLEDKLRNRVRCG